MARKVNYGSAAARPSWGMSGLTCLFVLERVTGIEPALSAWESVQSGPSVWPDLRSGLSVSDRESPRYTLVNGPLTRISTQRIARPLAVRWPRVYRV